MPPPLTATIARSGRWCQLLIGELLTDGIADEVDRRKSFGNRNRRPVRARGAVYEVVAGNGVAWVDIPFSFAANGVTSEANAGGLFTVTGASGVKNTPSPVTTLPLLALVGEPGSGRAAREAVL